MNKLTVLVLNIIISVSLNGQSRTLNSLTGPVFPGVSGFGTDTPGGRSGRLIKVTTLSREGPGSIAEAIKATGPRIVVFEVGGVIDLGGKLLGILNPYLTIAGQTAPSPGITFIRGGIAIGTHDVVIRHIRVRPGEAGHEKSSGWEVDGIETVGGAYDVIIDHCSLTWGTDENLSASGPQFDGNSPEEWRENTSHRIVFSNCIIAEGLSKSTHSKGEHSKGSLIGDNVTDVLILGNLYASNVERNPLFAGGTTGIIANNYIFNPRFAAMDFVFPYSEWGDRKPIPAKVIVESNVVEFGPDTKSNIAAGSFRGPFEIFWRDNKVIKGPEGREFSGEFTRLFDRPFWPGGLKLMPADSVKRYVLKNAGALPWNRDEIDTRIIESVRKKVSRVINSEKDAGGYPVLKPVFRKFNPNDWDLNSASPVK